MSLAGRAPTPFQSDVLNRCARQSRCARQLLHTVCIVWMVFCDAICIAESVFHGTAQGAVVRQHGRGSWRARIRSHDNVAVETFPYSSSAHIFVCHIF